MSNIFDIFSTREIALAIWLLIFLIFISRTKDVRRSIAGVVKAFFVKKLILAFSTLLLYMLIVICILSSIGLWDISLLKDTFLWLLFSGIVLFMNINKVENVNYFSKLIKDNIKIIAIWEFLFNLYTLSLIGELLLIPIVSLFSIMEVFAEHSSKKEESHKKVVILCKNILGLIGLGMIVYVVYKTITEYELLFSVSNIKSFLLPILLVILTLPYFYALALYLNYESYITVVKHIHRYKESKSSKGLIIATLKYANFNLNTLKRIWKYQVHFDSSKETPDEYIRRVAKKPKYVISDKAKLLKFNDVQTIVNSLSEIGIGKLDEWHKSYAGDDCYLSMTNYHKFGIDDITKIPNTLALYLTGEETHIKQLEVVLDIGWEQNKYQAIKKFTEVLQQIFNCIGIMLPDNLICSIADGKEQHYEYNTHEVSMNYEKFERIEQYKLTVITK
ncbi:hypothetical protein [Dysgonomonas sp. ZJ279]|uniref:hypothetical protein n=1 Tax=Dysgonomonas sp. ZJ279 TaxID=2709796 RepID=UPI0013EBE914|nr:hypothetical protein [Dysgonomonas sp. ZJ279]